MKRKISHIIILTVLTVILISCSAHVHRVGNGPQGSRTEEARQWYVLWGLVPINDAQTANMVPADVNDYEIKTEQSFLDVIINIFTGSVTVYSRTVKVTY